MSVTYEMRNDLPGVKFTKERGIQNGLQYRREIQIKPLTMRKVMVPGELHTELL